MSEKVLVMHNNLLISHIQACGGRLITGLQDQVFNKILKNHIFLPRDEAEYDFMHKQIIPYVVIRYNNDYLLLQRTTNQAEKRLHNKYSLGIGGHINPVLSISEENIIIESLYRELNEEVRVSEHGSLRFIGIINDDSNSVSKVHLGLLYLLEVLSPEFEVLEKDKMTGRWVSQQTLKEYYGKFETWSQIVFDEYINAGVKESRGQGVKCKDQKTKNSL